MAELGNQAQTFRNTQVTVGWHHKAVEDTKRIDRTSEMHHLGSVTSRKGLIFRSVFLGTPELSEMFLRVTAGLQHCSHHPSDHICSCPPLENQQTSIITELWNDWGRKGP